jgi:enoyl-CoA hydratase
MGDSYESVTVAIADHVAVVTLIGPGKGNAMGPAFWAERPVVFADLDADPDVRAIVLTGSGKNFSYGLDLAAMGDTLSSMMTDGSSAGGASVPGRRSGVMRPTLRSGYESVV